MSGQQSLQPTPRRERVQCFFCVPHQLETRALQYLGEPHRGPCGQPCFGGADPDVVQTHRGEVLEEWVLSHHLDRGDCRHCAATEDAHEAA